jgi:hypothetical protein
MRLATTALVLLSASLALGSGVARAAEVGAAGPAPLVDGRQYTVTWAACSTVYGAEGGERIFAEQAFPAHSAFSLSRVTVLAPAGVGAPAGYGYAKVGDGIFVKDGALAVSCGTASERRFPGVWLVLPRAYRVDLDATDPWR